MKPKRINNIIPCGVDAASRKSKYIENIKRIIENSNQPANSNKVSNLNSIYNLCRSELGNEY